MTAPSDPTPAATEPEDRHYTIAAARVWRSIDVLRNVCKLDKPDSRLIIHVVQMAERQMIDERNPMGWAPFPVDEPTPPIPGMTPADMEDLGKMLRSRLVEYRAERQLLGEDEPDDPRAMPYQE